MSRVSSCMLLCCPVSVSVSAGLEVGPPYTYSKMVASNSLLLLFSWETGSRKIKILIDALRRRVHLFGCYRPPYNRTHTQTTLEEPPRTHTQHRKPLHAYRPHTDPALETPASTRSNPHVATSDNSSALSTHAHEQLQHVAPPVREHTPAHDHRTSKNHGSRCTNNQQPSNPI